MAEVIPAQAVEAVMKASFEQGRFLKWEDASETLKERHRDLVRPILEAAAPHMLASAWDEGYEQGTLSQFQEPRNPYRPTP